jgi:GT2 family glycosyltransferase
MVRRSLFEQLGGYDEELAVGFNDGDFCLRVRASGHRVVFTPFALLHHREFSSRGREAADAQLQARYLREKAYTMARHADFLAAGDPTVSPHLDRFSPWRELRRP